MGTLSPTRLLPVGVVVRFSTQILYARNAESFPTLVGSFQKDHGFILFERVLSAFVVCSFVWCSLSLERICRIEFRLLNIS